MVWLTVACGRRRRWDGLRLAVEGTGDGAPARDVKSVVLPVVPQPVTSLPPPPAGDGEGAVVARPPDEALWGRNWRATVTAEPADSEFLACCCSACRDAHPPQKKRQKRKTTQQVNNHGTTNYRHTHTTPTDSAWRDRHTHTHTHTHTQRTLSRMREPEASVSNTMRCRSHKMTERRDGILRVVAQAVMARFASSSSCSNGASGWGGPSWCSSVMIHCTHHNAGQQSTTQHRNRHR